VKDRKLREGITMRNVNVEKDVLNGTVLNYGGKEKELHYGNWAQVARARGGVSGCKPPLLKFSSMSRLKFTNFTCLKYEDLVLNT
jgi:hypothetical protein